MLLKQFNLILVISHFFYYFSKEIMKSCCESNDKKDKSCERITDKKTFSLPRRFTKKRCIDGPVRGFTMKSSCAPFQGCISQKVRGYLKKSKKSKKKTKTKKPKMQFLYNPDDPKRSFDVYIDKDPSDTIPIKYTTVEDVEETIKKLERLYKTGKYPHKRIWQVGMILYVRLKVIKKKKMEHYKLAKRYFLFLGKRTKIKGDKERKAFTFTI